MPFWQFCRNWLIGWIGQPSISANRKWPEMIVSDSSNQVWTKITIWSYVWSFAIQIQIQAVWFINRNRRKYQRLQNRPKKQWQSNSFFFASNFCRSFSRWPLLHRTNLRWRFCKIFGLLRIFELLHFTIF